MTRHDPATLPTEMRAMIRPAMAADLVTWGSAALSDGLRQIGHYFTTMESAIKPIAPSMAAAGPAFTVRCYPGATWAMEEALERAEPGDVLVVDGGAVTDLILMGELMSRRAYQRGIAAAVVDGAVRDVEGVIDVGFPVFARGVGCRAGTYDKIGEWQTTICCGRIPVRSGDWIVADRNGVVCVPQELVEDAAEAARRVHERELGIARRLREGDTLAEAAAGANGRKR